MAGTNPGNPLMDRVRVFNQTTAYDKTHETKLVEVILTQMGQADLVKDLKRQDAEGHISFAEFNAHANFPMQLAYWRMSGETPIHASPGYVHPLWFKSFTSLPIVEQFASRYDEASKDKPFGLIFPRKGIRLGLIIHNGSLETFVPPSTACHFFQGGGDQKINSMIVQPLPTLLSAVRTLLGLDQQ